jgi:hypothetical protein
MKLQFTMVVIGVAIFWLPCAQAADRRCEWVGNPAKATVWTPWVVTDPGIVWDTQQRTCTTTWTGKAIWYTIVRLRSCTASGGIGIGPDGPSVEAGGSYTWTDTIVEGSTVTQQGATGTRKVRETSCLFSSSEVIGLNQQFDETRHTHEALCNTWANATVTFDGNNVAFDECVNLNSAGVGFHQEVVSRTDGVHTDTFTFNIQVRPSYYFTKSRIADTINPSKIMAFHNDSPDAIDVEFTAVPNLTGLVTGVVLNNRELVPPGGIAYVQVEFYTSPGYVIGPGQVPEGTVFARERDSSGEVLASAFVDHLAHGIPGIPTVSEWGLGVMAILVLTAATVVIMRRRAVAAE